MAKIIQSISATLLCLFSASAFAKPITRENPLPAIGITQVQKVVSHLPDRADKLVVYRLWIDALQLKVADADQDRLAGKLSNDQYDTYLDNIAQLIQFIATAVHDLGYVSLSQEWKKLGGQYAKITAHPEALAAKI